MSWGIVAGAAVSLVGGYMNKRSNDKEAGQIAEGSEASNELMRYMYDQDVARQQPFYNAGLAGLNEYTAMLGLGNGQAGGQSGGYVTGGGSGPQGQGWMTPVGGGGTPTQWLGGGSTPSVNQQLYASDPAYRQAWDRATSEHRQQWGKDYTNDSDANVITQRLKTLYNQYKPTQQATSKQAPSQTPEQLQQAAFAKFRSAPGYQFGLDEGRGQVEASAAARGGLNSGATLKALQRYGNDYADQQGYTPHMNRLASLFGAAQTSAGAMGQSGQHYGGKIAQNTQNAANARANSTYNTGQGWQDSLGSAWGYANKGAAQNGWW